MPEIDISGSMGNAHFIIGQVEQWLRDIRRHDLIETYQAKATEGSYDELLDYTKRFCAELGIDVEFVKDDEKDDGDYSHWNEEAEIVRRAENPEIEGRDYPPDPYDEYPE